jgi:hypothetical protein
MIILIIIVMLFYFLNNMRKFESPNNIFVNKGNSKENEDVSILLDRIDWCNHYQGRLDIFSRNGFCSIIICFFISIIYENSNILNLLQSILIVWFLLNQSTFYFTHHSDKFCSYFIDKNIKLIRKKLRLNSNIHKLKNIPFKYKGEDDCWTFIYLNF